ncbi:LysR family transcriptional regulator [Nocardia carnea]|uniref:LysR family transcriptional regulator n=1 Tax=Nocardia carnea TaxID=37328 RepID=UPI0024579FED|nr:LysR family transcriptional regulator [Nocardia carnea]
MFNGWPDLVVLELLVGVDDHGSLGAASRIAGVAQPNASRAIKRLEAQVGTPLLQRKPTGSTLTPEGTVIAHWSRKVLEDARRLLDVAAGMREKRAAELTVSASMTVAEHLMPAWLGQFRRTAPDVTIHLQVRNSMQVFDDVTAGHCDVGFVESPTVPRALHSVAVARDRLVVVVDPRHPWTRRRRPLSVAELARTPLVVREPGSGTRTTLDLALHEYDRAAPQRGGGSGGALRKRVVGGVGAGGGPPPPPPTTFSSPDFTWAETARVLRTAGPTPPSTLVLMAAPLPSSSRGAAQSYSWRARSSVGPRAGAGARAPSGGPAR